MNWICELTKNYFMGTPRIPRDYIYLVPEDTKSLRACNPANIASNSYAMRLMAVDHYGCVQNPGDIISINSRNYVRNATKKKIVI